jgi:hypothetical protein
MASHDQSYKLLFSHPRMVRDLLVGFVRGKWRRWIDLRSLAKANAHFVTDSLRRRAGDMVWRARSKGSVARIYLLLEFQSTVERFMVVRMLTYLGLLYQDVIKAGRLSRRNLPPVLPIVLYNGPTRWRAPTTLRTLVRAHPTFPKGFRAHMRYQVIDIRRLRFDAPGLKRNLVAAMFRIENSRDRREIRETVRRLSRVLDGPSSASLHRAFVAWIVKVILARFRRIPRQKVHTLEEVDAMLADRWEQWEVELKAEGRREGRVELLLDQLHARFGRELPRWVQRHLQRATNAELRRWGKRVLKAASLHELFGRQRRVDTGGARRRASGERVSA